MAGSLPLFFSLKRRQTTSDIRGISMTDMVSIDSSARIEISSPVSKDLTDTPQVALTERVMESMRAFSRSRGGLRRSLEGESGIG